MPLTGSFSPIKHDRKLALSFGALVLLLMLAVSSVAAYLFTQLYEKEEDRLSSMLAVIFADAITKVSFSGKYHARLFVEEMQGRVPALAFISVEDKEGKVLAHSQPEKNDTLLQGKDEARLRNLSLQNGVVSSADTTHAGQVVKEVVQAYRSELDNEIVGVVRLGIKMEEVHKEWHSTVVAIIILIIVLTLIAIAGVLLLSRYFGGALRVLADQLRGIMAYSPLPISITDRNGQLLTCSKQAEQLFGAKAEGQPLKQFLKGSLSPAAVRQLTESNDIVFTDGNPLEREMEIELHGRSRVWFVSKFAIAHDTHDQPSLICTFVHDITELRQAEQERLAHLRFLKFMDDVNRAIQESMDLEQMMVKVLDVVLSIFSCDRAFLMYPCDPESPTWKVPMERTTHEYPGILSLNIEMEMDHQVAETLRVLLAADGAVKFGPNTPFPLPDEVSEQFGFKSFMSMALYPKTGKPWQFGLHQCSYERIWTTEEERILQEIGRRLEDALSSLLITRNLRESEDRYRMVFENSPVSIWEEDFSGVKAIFDDLKAKGIENIEDYLNRYPTVLQQCAESVHIVDVNQATLVLHGAASKEELLTGLIRTFTPESFATFRQELVKLWNGRTEMVKDTVVKTLSGERRHVTVYFSVCPGHENTLSKVIVSLIDITKRKQAEDKMLQADQRLRLHSKLSPLGFLEWDENFQTIEWNTACEHIFGYSREEAIGKHAKDLILPVEVQDLVDGIFHSLMQQTGGQHSINENITKDGSTITCEWFNTPLIDNAGQAIGVASICRDITEQKQMEEELATYRLDLEEQVKKRTADLKMANQELEAFAYSVSHDLRAPLRHIDGFLELLEKRLATGLDEQSHHYMNTISESARKMGQLIDDLLAFSRMGRQAMSVNTVDLGFLVQEVIRDFEPETRDRNIHWHIGELPAVVADRSMLRMVFVNLLANALKFTQPREKTCIEIGSVAGTKKEEVIYIRDNGVGFDMAYVDKLFGVFQRLHHADEFEGTGIGLANVRRIISRHGGRTWAESEPDQGAVFYFSLPHSRGGNKNDKTQTHPAGRG